jgi:hypothetical protein
VLRILPIAALWVSPAAAADPVQVCEPGAVGAPSAELRVHVVSAAPGWDLMSSMGHTVLLFSGGNVTEPVAYNWGLFEGTDQGLVVPFLRGTLPYHVGAVPWSAFWEANVGHGRTLVAQRLQLDPGAAEALLALSEDAAAPEHRSYRYHWADANCATKVRDALDDVTGGALRRALDHPVDTTPRIEGSRHLWRWGPVRFAWRFVTSDRLDAPLTAWERAMVPEHLMRALEEVTVDGRPLVAETCAVSVGLFGWAPERLPPSPVLPAAGAMVAIAALGASRRHDPRPRLAGWIVGLWGLLLAVIGTSSLALWAVSDLDGLGPTENWLLAGPQSWVLVAVGWRLARGRLPGRAGTAACWAVGAAGVACALLDLLPGVDQANADMLLALLPGLLGCVAAVSRLRAALR